MAMSRLLMAVVLVCIHTAAAASLIKIILPNARLRHFSNFGHHRTLGSAYLFPFAQKISVAHSNSQTTTALPSTMADAPKLSDAVDSLSASLKTMVLQAKNLYHRRFGDTSDQAWVTVAPGRVNLIGEHTDYTGGFVLPLAIDYSTVVYGTGRLVTGTTTSKIRFVSSNEPESLDIEEHTLEVTSRPLDANDPEARNWIWYILGVVAQYLPDLPADTGFDMSVAIVGNVPLGSGLSSSAALEVSVARFIECVLGEKEFSPKTRALRCQKAENEWCHSPCGIMDQLVSSAASEGALLLIDCTSLEYTKVHTTNPPSLVVTNSHVKHSIGGGEYPVRVKQCQEAEAALSAKGISSLRDATLQDVEDVKKEMGPVIYKRAKHVVTENARTVQAKAALESSDWKTVGELMNASHASMRDDYEVSCKEIDILVDLAQGFPGVYGSRLTGGGFGGCTVTLVEKDKVQALMDYLRKEYSIKTLVECECFETTPGPGARLLAVDSV